MTYFLSFLHLWKNLTAGSLSSFSKLRLLNYVPESFFWKRANLLTLYFKLIMPASCISCPELRMILCKMEMIFFTLWLFPLGKLFSSSFIVLSKAHQNCQVLVWGAGNLFINVFCFEIAFPWCKRQSVFKIAFLLSCVSLQNRKESVALSSVS